MNLRRIASLCCLGLLLCGCDDSSLPKQTKSQNALAKLQQTFFDKHPEFIHGNKVFIGGKRVVPVEKWEKAMRECKDAETNAADALKIALAAPKTPTAMGAAYWILSYFPETESASEAVNILSRDFLGQFIEHCRISIDANFPFNDHLFRVMAEKSPNRQIQGQALLARARFRKEIMLDDTTAVSLCREVVEKFAEVNASSESSAKLGLLATDYLGKIESAATPVVRLQAGQKLPLFKATTTDGKLVQVPGDYKGKLVLLDFWATWCGPCVREIPYLVNTYRKYHAAGLEMLSVSIDKDKAGELVARFTKANHMTWPQIYDGQYRDGVLFRTFCSEGIPAAFLIDGDTGLILASGNDLRGDALDRTIARTLEQRKQ